MNNEPLTPEAAQRTATIIGLSLPAGVTLFVFITWFLHQSGAAPQADPGFARVLVYAWIALAATTAFTALFFWRTRVEPLISSSEPLPRARIGELTSNLLICWACVETAALFGAAVYFLSGILWVGAVSVVMIWVAVLSTRPQLEWFERFSG